MFLMIFKHISGIYLKKAGISFYLMEQCPIQAFLQELEAEILVKLVLVKSINYFKTKSWEKKTHGLHRR